MKKLFLLLAISCYTALQAQSDAKVSSSLFTINFLMPSLEYETGITDKTTLDFRLGTGFSLVHGEFTGGTDFGIYPNLQGQYRYYYNFEKRLKQERRIANNSANYLALHSGVYTGKPLIGELQLNPDYSFVAGPVWGFQRNYESGFALDLNFGAGYGFSEIGESYISPIISVRLGWLLAD